jgi:mono/diheme cytochrome c family protein
MKKFLVLVGVFALLAVAALAFIFSGLFDVAATTPDSGLIEWALETTQHRSVQRRSAGIPVPPLEDPEMIRIGLIEYHEMCVTCHGGPGIPASEIGQGLNPYPPELATRDRHDLREAFWVIQNGIKMTGMPAFGPTHTDEKLWAIVAFMNAMPKISPAEYQARLQEAGLAPGGPEENEEVGAGHSHAPGTPPHVD